MLRNFWYGTFLCICLSNYVTDECFDLALQPLSNDFHERKMVTQTIGLIDLRVPRTAQVSTKARGHIIRVVLHYLCSKTGSIYQAHNPCSRGRLSNVLDTTLLSLRNTMG